MKDAKNFSSFSKRHYDFTNCKAGNEGCQKFLIFLEVLSFIYGIYISLMVNAGILKKEIPLLIVTIMIYISPMTIIANPMA